MRLIFCVIVTLSSAMYAFAHDVLGSKLIPSDSTLGLISFVKIVIDDQAKGGCWTNANYVKSNLRLKFEQNGIETIKYDMQYANAFHPNVAITVIGFRQQNKSCVGYASLEVLHDSQSIFGGANGRDSYVAQHFTNNFNKGSLFTSGSKLNSQLNKFFEAASSELIADIISGRRNVVVKAFKAEYPKAFEQPMSRAEFIEIIESYKKKSK